MKTIQNILLITTIITLTGCLGVPSGYVKLQSNQKFYKKTDEFQGISWYQHGYFFQSSLMPKPFQLYVEESKSLLESRKKAEELLAKVTDEEAKEKLKKVLGNSTKEGKTLKLELNYKGSSWIFFNNGTIINSNGGKMEWNIFKDKVGMTKSYDRKTDVLSGGNVTETYTVSLSEDKSKELFQLLSKPGEVKLRLSGKKSHQDYPIDFTNKNALLDVIKFIYNFS